MISDPADIFPEDVEVNFNVKEITSKWIISVVKCACMCVCVCGEEAFDLLLVHLFIYIYLFIIEFIFHLYFHLFNHSLIHQPMHRSI